MSGWIKLHRKMLDWCWWRDRKTRDLFITLLMMANHDESTFLGRKIERGQVAAGRRTLAEFSGLSEQEVKTSLKKLKSTSEITSKSTSNFSIITICNYDKYQENEQGKQPAKQPAKQPTDQPAEQPHPRKEEKKKKDKTYRFDPTTIKPAYFSESDWTDLIAHRKKKKATETERAYTALIREFDKAVEQGHQPSDIVDIICQRNWTGFKAEWITERKAHANSGDEFKRSCATDLLQKKINKARNSGADNGRGEGVGDKVQPEEDGRGSGDAGNSVLRRLDLSRRVRN